MKARDLPIPRRGVVRVRILRPQTEARGTLLLLFLPSFDVGLLDGATGGICVRKWLIFIAGVGS